MTDFISLSEASDTTGWSVDRIVSIALREPESLELWVLPDEGGWRADLLVAGLDEEQPRWHSERPYPVWLKAPIHVPTDVIREQVRGEGRIRLLPGDGKPVLLPRERIGYTEFSMDLRDGSWVVTEDSAVTQHRVEAFRLVPPRRVDAAWRWCMALVHGSG